MQGHFFLGLKFKYKSWYGGKNHVQNLINVDKKAGEEGSNAL